MRFPDAQARHCVRHGIRGRMHVPRGNSDARMSRDSHLCPLRSPIFRVASETCAATSIKQMAGRCYRHNDQWRVCFVWREKGGYNVEILDFH
jgi:hypothetical protein